MRFPLPAFRGAAASSADVRYEVQISTLRARVREILMSADLLLMRRLA